MCQDNKQSWCYGHPIYGSSCEPWVRIYKHDNNKKEHENESNKEEYKNENNCDKSENNINFNTTVNISQNGGAEGGYANGGAVERIPVERNSSELVGDGIGGDGGDGGGGTVNNSATVNVENLLVICCDKHNSGSSLSIGTNNRKIDINVDENGNAFINGRKLDGTKLDNGTRVFVI